jgi:hypothetical protein
MDIGREVGRVPAQIMKSNASNSVLTVLLAISLLTSVIFCLQFFFQTRELRRLNGQINNINNYRNGIQALAADCLQYSEKNPSINPVLESVGLKAPKTNSAAAKPAAK